VEVLILETLMRILELRSLAIIDAKGLTQELLYELREVVEVKNGFIRVVNPIGLAMITIKLGVDVEKVSKLLDWRDFEKLCVEALEAHSFRVKAPLRFKYEDRRYEIDIVACKDELMLAIDCKHWMAKGQSYMVKNASLKHLDKCLKLAKIQNVKLIVPIIITLREIKPKSPIDKVLIVPVFKLNSFLLDLEANMDKLPLINHL